MAIRPLNTANSQSSNYNEINNMIRQINNEATTKVFKQAAGNAIVTGKLPYEGGYGTLWYNSDGVPTGVAGVLPDGTTGMVWAKEGENVLELFN